MRHAAPFPLVPPRALPLVLALALGVSACMDEPTFPTPQSAAPVAAERMEAALSVNADTGEQTFAVIAHGVLPDGIGEQLEAAGASVVRTLPEIGVVVATSADPGFAARAGRIAGVRSVVADVILPGVDPSPSQRRVTTEQVGNPPSSGSDNVFFDLQWGHAAIEAPAAWAAGARGAGVRVAVLDNGISSTHPDLVPNLNVGLSTSFVAGEAFDDPPGDHGTHVAGTIAASDLNTFGVIGIAPDAEIVAVKVLAAGTGSGTILSLVEGIVYAGAIEAKVINMSLGARYQRSGAVFLPEFGVWAPAPPEAIAELVTLLERATRYARQQGATIISSAGNAATNRNFTRDVVVIPTDLPHVISISATGPLGWVLDFDTNLDVPAFYTEHGKARIDYAAPGGNVDFGLQESGQVCGFVVLAQCWAFDLVFSTGAFDDWFWSAGTSMAAPHASGVAALIIGQGGGSMHPSRVEARLRESADRVGDPGKDDFYGHGRVNAARAVGH